MDTGFSELQIFISLVLVLGTAFVALVVDYLKSTNERLREHNVELRARREENDRTRSVEAAQLLQNALAKAAPASQAEPSPVAGPEPVKVPEAPPAVAAKPPAPPVQPPPPIKTAPAHARATLEARREALRRVSMVEPPSEKPQIQPALPPSPPAPVAEPEPVAAVNPELLLEPLPTPEWLNEERETAIAAVSAAPVDVAPVDVVEPTPEVVVAAPEPEPVIAPAPPPVPESRVAFNWRPPAIEPTPEPQPELVFSEPVATEPVAEEPAVPEPVAAEPVPPEPVTAEPIAVVPPTPEPERVEVREPDRDNFWIYRGLLDRVVEEQEVRVPPARTEPQAPIETAANTPPPVVEVEMIAATPAAPVADQPPPVKSPLSKWASRLQTNRGMNQRPEAPSGAGGSKAMPSWVDRALQKEAARTAEPDPARSEAALATPIPAGPPPMTPVVPEEPAVVEAREPSAEAFVELSAEPPVFEQQEPVAAVAAIEELAPSFEQTPVIEAEQQPVIPAAEPVEVAAVTSTGEPATSPEPMPVIEAEPPVIPAAEPVETAAVVAIEQPAAEVPVEAESPAVFTGQPVTAHTINYIEVPNTPEPEPLPVVAPEPEPQRIPSGYHDRAVLTTLMQSSEPVNGVLVAIGINDYQHNVETMGRQAMHDLMRSVERMIRGLLREEDFACRSNDDEFILFFPGETGAAAQRRLTTISERLWNFQLRSLSSFSVLFSWGAVETQGETLSDAVAAASERMYQTKRNRKTTDQRKKLAV